MATEGLSRYKSLLRGDNKIQKGKAYYVLAGRFAMSSYQE